MRDLACFQRMIFLIWSVSTTVHPDDHVNTRLSDYLTTSCLASLQRQYICWNYVFLPFIFISIKRGQRSMTCFLLYRWWSLMFKTYIAISLLKCTAMFIAVYILYQSSSLVLYRSVQSLKPPHTRGEIVCTLGSPRHWYTVDAIIKKKQRLGRLKR